MSKLGTRFGDLWWTVRCDAQFTAQVHIEDREGRYIASIGTNDESGDLAMDLANLIICASKTRDALVSMIDNAQPGPLPGLLTFTITQEWADLLGAQLNLPAEAEE